MDYCRVCCRLVGGLKAIPIDSENHPAMSHKDILIGALDRVGHRQPEFVRSQTISKAPPTNLTMHGKISCAYCEAVSINLREVLMGTRL